MRFLGSPVRIVDNPIKANVNVSVALRDRAENNRASL